MPNRDEERSLQDRISTLDTQTLAIQQRLDGMAITCEREMHEIRQAIKTLTELVTRTTETTNQALTAITGNAERSGLRERVREHETRLARIEVALEKLATEVASKPSEKTIIDTVSRHAPGAAAGAGGSAVLLAVIYALLEFLKNS